jgi:hypothetical protein
MSTLAYLDFHHRTKKNLSLHSSSSVSPLKPPFLDVNNHLFFLLCFQRIYRVRKNTRSKAEMQVQSQREPKKSREDGASAYPIENYLFVVILITPCPTKDQGVE